MPKSETKDTITLMYVPGRTGRIRRFNVPRFWIRRTLLSISMLVLLLSLAGFDYVRARRQLVELDELRNLAAAQGDELASYSTRLAEISEGLEQVAQLDRKLRVITALDPADPLPLPGIGGVEDDLFDGVSLGGLSRERRQKRMHETFEKLSEATNVEADSLTELIGHLEDQTLRLAGTPSVVPTRGWVTSKFGYRTSPFTGHREFHRGLDIAGRKGTAVLAPADGVVRSAAKKGALGNAVTIEHGYGIRTVYGHLSEILVRAGEKVQRGDKLALLGNTGRSTGPHLHYQVEVNGKPVDPQNYILD